MKDHISKHRREIAQEKIRAKIMVLERYAAKGIAEGAFVPKDLASFRHWEDKSLGLERIGSPNTLDKPYNEKLKRQALELIKEFAEKEKRKDGRIKIIDKLRDQVKKLTRLVRELANQLHSTRHDLDQVRQSEKRLEKRVKDLNEENAELRRTLNTVTGLKAVGGGTEEAYYATK